MQVTYRRDRMLLRLTKHEREQFEAARMLMIRLGRLTDAAVFDAAADAMNDAVAALDQWAKPMPDEPAG